MKKRYKLTLITLAIPAILIIINLFTMRSIKTEITINASKEKVWSLLMNHENYANWNPFIKKIAGGKTPGEKLEVTIQSEGNKPMDFSPLVLTNQKEKEFRWKGKLFVQGLFDGEHYFQIVEEGENKIKFIQGENFTGLLSGVLTSILYEDTKKGFEQMNEALKKLSEKE